MQYGKHTLWFDSVDVYAEKAPSTIFRRCHDGAVTVSRRCHGGITEVFRQNYKRHLPDIIDFKFFLADSKNKSWNKERSTLLLSSPSLPSLLLFRFLKTEKKEFVELSVFAIDNFQNHTANEKQYGKQQNEATHDEGRKTRNLTLIHI